MEDVIWQSSFSLLICQSLYPPHGSEDGLKRDTCVPLFGYYAVETMAPKKLGWSQESHKAEAWCQPENGETCLSGSDVTQFRQRARPPCRPHWSRVMVGQWWADHTWPGQLTCTPFLWFKPKPQVRTPKMDLEEGFRWISVLFLTCLYSFPASTSWVLESKVCATTTILFFWIRISRCRPGWPQIPGDPLVSPLEY